MDYIVIQPKLRNRILIPIIFICTFAVITVFIDWIQGTSTALHVILATILVGYVIHIILMIIGEPKYIEQNSIFLSSESIEGPHPSSIVIEPGRETIKYRDIERVINSTGWIFPAPLIISKTGKRIIIDASINLKDRKTILAKLETYARLE